MPATVPLPQYRTRVCVKCLLRTHTCVCVYVPADEDEDDVGVRRACEVESCRGVGGAGGGAEGRGVQTLWSLELLRPPPPRGVCGLVYRHEVGGECHILTCKSPFAHKQYTPIFFNNSIHLASTWETIIANRRLSTYAVHSTYARLSASATI